ncbi:MAG: hypothetical protein LBQ66_05350 [Planctomycetaceae bacterium]|nr:hypothetical protein [Planctomycetaceae bacterium]
MFGSNTGHLPLFNDVCNYHKINDKKDRTLLTNIAQKYVPNCPVQIFLDREYLQKSLVDPEFAESVEKLNEFILKWFED